VKLTWEEVEARSAQKLGGMNVFCFDCRMCFDAVEMPCLKHCKDDEERRVRQERFDVEVKKAVAQLDRYKVARRRFD
jgi:hypothetical protein